MLKQITHGKSTWQFDEDTRRFGNGFLTVPLEWLPCISTGRPWRLQTGTCADVKALTDGARLRVEFTCGNFGIGLTFAFNASGMLECHAVLTASADVQDAVFGFCVPVADDAVMTMPMSLYNNNPSTPAERVVPRFPKSGAASLVLEDTRYPVPGASAEFGGQVVCLFVKPTGSLSLGAERLAAGDTRLVAMSGAIAFNGEHDVCYYIKNGTRPNAKGYRDFQAGERFEMDFALTWGAPERRGEGFRQLIDGAAAYLKPSARAVKSPAEVLALKYEAQKALWCEDGYLCLPPENCYRAPAYFLYGWAGQCMKMALCDIKLGLRNGDSEAIAHGLKAASFFVENSQTQTPGLRYQTFYLSERDWKPINDRHWQYVPARAEGETWADLGRIILLCRERAIAIPESFEAALREGLEFAWDHRLPNGIIPRVWSVDGAPAAEDISSAGTSFLSAFWALAKITGEKIWRERAEALHRLYWNCGGGDFSTPFSRATLDAGCEDKEACIPFFVASCEAWYFTRDPEYKHYAEASGDWLLTWVYFWNVPLRADSVCALNGFETCGWPSVSVENQHLDVFFPPWEMVAFGEDTGQEKYISLGRMVFNAWSHGISTGGGDWFFSQIGGQCEQFFQTDWVFPLPMSRIAEPFCYRMRKYGYSEGHVEERFAQGGANPWSPSWIVALVLYAAIEFTEKKR